MKKVCGIYCFYNKKEDAYYIGQSKNIEIRYQKHLLQLRQNIHKNYKLQKAWIRDGEDAFEFKVLMEAPEDALNHLEDYYIKKYNAISKGYNIQSGSTKYKSVEKEHTDFLFEVEEEFDKFSLLVFKKLFKDRKGETIDLVTLANFINVVHKMEVSIQLLVQMLRSIDFPIYAKVNLEDVCFDYDLSYNEKSFGEYEKEITDEEIEDFLDTPTRLYLKDKKICLDCHAKNSIEEHNKNIDKKIEVSLEELNKYRYKYGQLALFVLDNLEGVNFKKIEEIMKEKVILDQEIERLSESINNMEKQKIVLIFD